MDGPGYEGQALANSWRVTSLSGSCLDALGCNNQVQERWGPRGPNTAQDCHEQTSRGLNGAVECEDWDFGGYPPDSPLFIDLSEWSPKDTTEGQDGGRKWLADSLDWMATGGEESAAKGYELLGKIGEGAFGVVYKARRLADGEVVALKKIFKKRGEDESCPLKGVAREAWALQQLHHPNVIGLQEHFNIGSSLALVFHFCPHNLAEVIGRAQGPLSEGVVKGWLVQLLRGVAACHEAGVMHRDLKPANLLIAEDGTLKIADFGQARQHLPEESQQYTHTVATRWYRAPELLYGARVYTPAVDLWAVGCIFAELLTLRPLFPGDNDIDQLNRVVQTLGTPEESRWPGVSKLPDFHKIIFHPCQPKPWHQVLPNVPPHALQLLSKLIRYDPSSRISAAAALQDDYFFLEPLPVQLRDLPLPPPRSQKLHSEDWHCFQPLSPLQPSPTCIRENCSRSP